MFELGEKVGRGDVHLKLIRVAENLQKLIQINVQGVHGSIPKIEKYSDAVRILHIFLNPARLNSSSVLEWARFIGLTIGHLIMPKKLSFSVSCLLMTFLASV